MHDWYQRFAAIYNDVDRFPSLRHVAAELGLSVKTVKNRAGIARGDKEGPKLVSRVGTGRRPDAPNDPSIPIYRNSDLIEPIAKPVGEKNRYYILSSCQDQTTPHNDFMNNLEAYAEWLGDCEIMIAGYTYNKTVGEEIKQRSEKKTAEIAYHERLRPYLQNEQFKLCHGLLFCGEMNTNPTAIRPLSGFETYTTENWGIFPHPKVQLTAVPNGKFERTKHLMTTGCVTLPNYIQKKAGIKASFHHIIGAVLVEVTPEGLFFCRHLAADGHGADEGGFYDLDRRVEAGKVTEGHAWEGLNPGDIHHEKLDPTVALTTFGYDVEKQARVDVDNLVDRFRPANVFYHDLSDFSPRNHHNIKDPHFMFRTHSTRTDNVEEALRGASTFLAANRRDFAQSVVVQSNHDNALLRWLKTVEWREDPENAIFYLKTQLEYLEGIERGEDEPPIFERVLRSLDEDELEGVLFVAEDDSYVIAGNIECAMHGHLGANGSRGNPKQFSKFGRKSNTGHTHSAAIFDGAYVAGVSGTLDMGYNSGASSWSHSHIATYANGKRAILTMMQGQWFAERLENISQEANSALVSDTMHGR